MGVRDELTAPVSPWRNGLAERLTGRSAASACIISSLSARLICAGSRDPTGYYNEVRTHRSLDKDALVFSPFSDRQHQIVPHSGETPSPLRFGFRFLVHKGS